MPARPSFHVGGGGGLALSLTRHGYGAPRHHKKAENDKAECDGPFEKNTDAAVGHDH